MNHELATQIHADARFVELVDTRNRYNWIMAIIMMVIYFVFILLIAFQPGLLAIKVAAGSPISVGILGGFLVILIAIGMTGMYIMRANKEFDRLTAELQEHVR
ncbi:MAG: hypothetical protein B7Y40_06465 [Gammaproteobacteria bacterium 28-57-27]|nr:MAG: hypothetical protein B7Y40_06465 [Gammaproteobacteria bacterium 28-57-27]